MSTASKRAIRLNVFTPGDRPVMDLSDALVLDAKEKARKLAKDWRKRSEKWKQFNPPTAWAIARCARELDKAFDLDRKASPDESKEARE